MLGSVIVRVRRTEAALGSASPGAPASALSEPSPGPPAGGDKGKGKGKVLKPIFSLAMPTSLLRAPEMFRAL